ncbi:MAG: hypothetical protein ACPL4K_05785, partial [Candidatus Margulisiibacteriota bacterium]
MTKRKIYGLLSILAILFFIIILRLVDLQIINHRFYQEKSQEQRTRIIRLPYRRGDIYDRNGQVLASSVDSYSVFKQGKGFAWVARKLPRDQAESLRAQNPREYFVLKELKRVYPHGRLSSQVLGFVGADNQGLAGIELAWDKYLSGKEGKVITEGDPEGKELYGALREIEAGENGSNITLTIDSNLQ